MKLDRTLVKELKALTSDRSRESKCALLRRLDAVSHDLSVIDIRDTFDACLRKHGRALVAVCVAATLSLRKGRIDYWGYEWACEVIQTVPADLSERNLERAYIDDNIHPTAICEYAKSFIKLTSEG